MLFILVGIIFLLYFLGISCYTGLNSKFPIVWLVMGLFCLILGLGLQYHWITPETYMKLWNRVTYILLSACSILYLTIQILIFSQFRRKVKKGLPYIIVLGAQMKPFGPSRILKRRLEKAYDYLVLNKNTVVIVSGGQGANEPMSEAEGMKRYLITKGIDSERILKEDLSVNTYQNMVFSKKLYLKNITEIGIVTSNYHLFRAKKIAQKAGFQAVYGIPAHAEPFMLLNHTSREVLGIIKDYLVGNL